MLVDDLLLLETGDGILLLETGDGGLILDQMVVPDILGGGIGRLEEDRPRVREDNADTFALVMAVYRKQKRRYLVA